MNIMIKLTFFLLIYCFSVSWLVLLLQKTGVRNRLIERCPKLLSEMFSCDFCLCWWLNVSGTLITSIVLSNILIVALAIPMTVISRKML
jgi:hypothetical protein